jgi:hypothetical protein
VFPAIPPVNLQGDTLPGEGTALLGTEGDSLLWYLNETGGNPLGGGSFFETPIISQTTSFFVENLSIYEGLAGKVGQQQHTGVSLFNGDTFNGDLTFEVHSPMIWRSVKAFTDTPGNRELQVRTDNNLLVATRDLQIDNPETDTLFELDIFLEPGAYLVTTNQSVNNNELGHPSPRLYRSNEDVAYPYELEGLVSLTGSTAGLQFYYYFYDWEVEGVTVCRSERLEVIAVVDSALSVANIPAETGVRVFPNPVHSSLQVEFANEGPVSLHLFNSQGQIVVSRETEARRGEVLLVPVADLSEGIYLLRVGQGNKQSIHKIIKDE